VGVMFCSNDCFSADHAVYSLEGVVCSGWFRIHNPKTRKSLTLLTKTGCSHRGFSGVFDDLYAAISLARILIWIPVAIPSQVNRPRNRGL